MWDSRKTWRCRLFGCIPVTAGDDTTYCRRCKRIIWIALEHFLPNEDDFRNASLLRKQKEIAE